LRIDRSVFVKSTAPAGPTEKHKSANAEEIAPARISSPMDQA
jgi:hypothetical protein